MSIYLTGVLLANICSFTFYFVILEGGLRPIKKLLDIFIFSLLSWFVVAVACLGLLFLGALIEYAE